MYFFKYTEDELEDYYKTIAGHTDLPVLVYATDLMSNISVVRLMTKLIEVPNIIGVKCTIRDYYQMRQIREINNGNINLFNGPDETLICGLVMGADGGIGSTYNVMPDWFSQLYSAYMRGDLKMAQEYRYRINRVIDILIKYGINGVVKSIKAVLEIMGYEVGRAISPAKELTVQQKQDMKRELEAFDNRFVMH